MKYILLVVLLSFNVMAENWGNVGIDNAKIHGGDLHDYYNADVEQLNANSWKLTSNTNSRACVAVDDEWKDWNCKRGDVRLVEWYQKEATMEYSFDFIIYEYPAWPSPYWMIVLQDWRKQNVKDSMGRHPITTLKLKNYNGGLYLGHFDNSWQWEYDFPIDDPTDTTHSIPDWNRGCWGEAPNPNDGIHHQENTCNGVYPMQLNTYYNVKFVISQTGASLIVDGNVVTDVEYKTKSTVEWSFIKWGMYWDEFYNTANDPNYRTVYSIENFTRSIKLK